MDVEMMMGIWVLGIFLVGRGGGVRWTIVAAIEAGDRCKRY
jgi:hypothetical protein